MIVQTFNDIYTEELVHDAILNEEFSGFREDYLILHCLIRKYKEKLHSFFEIGTNMGTGTKIIKNAIGNSPVYSLDLPFESLHSSLRRGNRDIVGVNCTLPYLQLRGDSLTFDFSLYPCDGYFIDGEHDFEHPFTESFKVLELQPNIIIWHDSNIVSVWEAINTSLRTFKEYDLYRVTDTRMAYALKKEE